MNILLLLTLCRVSDAWSIEHLTAVLGETVTISCNYPEMFKSKPKCLAKRFDDSHTIVVSTTESPKGRFSISDDRMSNTMSVNIINVTQEDSGDYSCKVMKGNTLKWIYLEIIARPSSTLKPTTYRHTSPLGTAFTSKGQFTRSSSTLEPTTYRNTSVVQTAFTFDEQFSFAIITACFFIALILLGGLFMTKYRQRQHKTHAAITCCVDSACSGQKTTGGDDENDPPISRQLSLKDTGSYKCGEVDAWDVKIDLKVKTHQCCMEPKMMNTSLGKTVNINFNYPPEYEGKTKIFFKLFRQPSSGGKPVVEVARTHCQRGRFSISDDRESKDLSVRISDVREDDGGVYFCGVWNRGESLSYYSLFKEINLQVTVETTTEDPKRKVRSVSSGPVIITVCVCVTVLLIAGSALIYKLVHNKAQGSVSSSSHAGTNRTLLVALSLRTLLMDRQKQWGEGGMDKYAGRDGEREELSTQYQCLWMDP
ncbi:hypothetical protein SRHO_G00178110 [Serrasalmus rhombeus]